VTTRGSFINDYRRTDQVIDTGKLKGHDRFTSYYITFVMGLLLSRTKHIGATVVRWLKN